MGYTHYFQLEKKDESVNLETLKSDIDKVLLGHKDIIQYEYDEAKPVVSKIDDDGYTIRFNGIGDDGHETFYFNTSHLDWRFCKTARKDYDIVVCKVLLILKAYYKGNLDLSSDGFCNSQPKDKVYKLNNRVNYGHLDGNWGDALSWFNKEIVNYIRFKCNVIDVYGKDNCYFKVGLKEF